MQKATLYLDVMGAALVVLFALYVWAPLALLAAGGFALFASWSLSRAEAPSEAPE